MQRSGLPKVIQIINGKDNAGLCFWTEKVPGVWGFYFPPLPPPVMEEWSLKLGTSGFNISFAT